MRCIGGGPVAEDVAAEVVELFAGLFGLEAEVEGFEAREALAVVEGELGEGGVGLTGSACAAEADLGGAVGEVAGACGGVEEELLGLGDVAGAEEVMDLVGRAVALARAPGEACDFS